MSQSKTNNDTIMRSASGGVMNGQSVADAARQYGVSPNALYHFLRSNYEPHQWKYKSRKKTAAFESQLAEWRKAKAERDSGTSYAEIGRRRGVSRQRAYQMVRKAEKHDQN